MLGEKMWVSTANLQKVRVCHDVRSTFLHCFGEIQKVKWKSLLMVGRYSEKVDPEEQNNAAFMRKVVGKI